MSGQRIIFGPEGRLEFRQSGHATRPSSPSSTMATKIATAALELPGIAITMAPETEHSAAVVEQVGQDVDALAAQFPD